MAELKVGDIIVSRNYGSIGGLHKIDRVTKTQAISSHVKFKKEYCEKYGSVDRIGKSSWDPSYSIATKKDLEEYKLDKAIYKLKNTKYEKLDNEKIFKILEIVEEEQ